MSSQALNLKSSTTLDLNLDVFTDLVATRCRLRRIYKKKKFRGGPSSPTYLRQKQAHFALAIFSPYLTSPYNAVTQGNTILPPSSPSSTSPSPSSSAHNSENNQHLISRTLGFTLLACLSCGHLRLLLRCSQTYKTSKNENSKNL